MLRLLAAANRVLRRESTVSLANIINRANEICSKGVVLGQNIINLKRQFRDKHETGVFKFISGFPHLITLNIKAGRQIAPFG